MTSVRKVSRRTLMAGAVAVFLAGCGALKPDPAITLKAEEAYVMLAAERYEDLFNMFTPAYQNAELISAIPEMHKRVPPGAASGPPVIAGWEFNTSTNGDRRIVTTVYTYPEMEVFTTVKTQFIGSAKDGWKIEGMNVESEPGTYSEKITLGKGKITPPPRTDITVADVKGG
jgi:hypothetical protein